MSQIYLQKILSGGTKDVDTGAGVYTGAFEKAELSVADALTVVVNKSGKVLAVMAGNDAIAFNTQVVANEAGPTYQLPYTMRRQVILQGKVNGIRAKQPK